MLGDAESGSAGLRLSAYRPDNQSAIRFHKRCFTSVELATGAANLR